MLSLGKIWQPAMLGGALGEAAPATAAVPGTGEAVAGGGVDVVQASPRARPAAALINARGRGK
jgi:hypothetical protein